MASTSRATKRASVHYVNNKDLYEALVEYKRLCAEARVSEKPQPQVTRYIGSCIMKIADKLSHRPNFINYSYRDEMISDAIDNMINYGVDKFDPSKSTNPFAYFTQIAFNAFRLRLQKEKKQQYIKYKTMDYMIMTGQLSETQEGDDAPAVTGGSMGGKGTETVASMRATSDRIIQSFEDGIEAKKVKKAAQVAASNLDKFLGEEEEVTDE